MPLVFNPCGVIDIPGANSTEMTIPSGEWVHVTATRDLEKEEWRFYLNGKLADTVYFSEFTEKQFFF